MAKGKNSGGKPTPPPPDQQSSRAPEGAGEAEEKKAYTTLRVLIPDAEDIAELADRLGMNVAETYKKHARPIVRKLLIDLAKKRLKELEERPDDE
ncbi:hypothetical protein [Gemmata obscuriglobus]|nr:hypothetical protein [Gemmata obscuriglobus]